MVAAEKLAIYLIPLIVLVLLGMFYYGPSGAFGRAQNITTGVIDFVNATVGADELSGGTPTIPENHREAILKLNETIKGMLIDDDLECFANYGGFPDLGEEGTSIIMVYNEQADRTDFRILGGEGGQQVITNLLFSIEGMHPCVVAGEKEINAEVVKVPEEFYRQFLESPSTGSLYGYYNNIVNQIKIFYGTEGANGNKIEVPELGDDIVNDQNNNLQDGGWLFKTSGFYGRADICFFPTVYGNADCDGDDSDGLDNNCLTDTSEDESLIWKNDHGTLNLCSEENEESLQVSNLQVNNLLITGNVYSVVTEITANSVTMRAYPCNPQLVGCVGQDIVHSLNSAQVFLDANPSLELVSTPTLVPEPQPEEQQNWWEAPPYSTNSQLIRDIVYESGVSALSPKIDLAINLNLPSVQAALGPNGIRVLAEDPAPIVRRHVASHLNNEYVQNAFDGSPDLIAGLRAEFPSTE